MAIKPLFRLGLDIPILMCLRDARHNNFFNSLLAMAESNLANGPVYFNCFPNFSASLLDTNAIEALTLNVKTKNLNFKINTRAIALIYRVYYKVMTSTIEPRAKLTLTPNETVLFEANSRHAQIQTPRRLRWNEITRSGSWDLKEINEPKPVELNNQVSQIIEHSDGSVRIEFASNFSQSTRFSTCSNNRPSTSSNRHSINRPSISLPRSQSAKSFRLHDVDFNEYILKPVYT